MTTDAKGTNPALELASLVKETDGLREEVRTLRVELKEIDLQVMLLEDQVGVDVSGRKLPMLPLVATILGAFAGLCSVLLNYILSIFILPMSRGSGIDSDTPGVAAGALVVLLVCALGFHFGGKQGAGGPARALLRPFTKWLLIVSGSYTVLLLVYALTR